MDRHLVWIRDDGGRAAAGFKGTAGDCVVRSIAIATSRPYREVYDALHDLIRESRTRRLKSKGWSPRDGVPMKVVHLYLAERGWCWTPTMRIGSGTKMHLRADELPQHMLIVRCSRHLTATVAGTVHDTYDPTRGGTRAVYGFWDRP